MRRSPWVIATGVTIAVALALAVPQLLSVGSGPSASPAPTSLFNSVPELLPPGKYLVDQVYEGQLTLEVPAKWTGLENRRGVAVIIKTIDGRPFGDVGNTALLGIYAVDRVYKDPCHDRDPAVGAPLTLAAIVAGLTHAVGFEAGPIEDAAIGGLNAKVFDLRTSIDGEGCRTFPFSQWTFRDQSGVQVGNGTSSGGHQRIWVLDVDGTVILIDADRRPDAPPEDVQELERIVKSIRFE